LSRSYSPIRPIRDIRSHRSLAVAVRIVRFFVFSFFAVQSEVEHAVQFVVQTVVSRLPRSKQATSILISPFCAISEYAAPAADATPSVTPLSTDPAFSA
jgi:hypothetical protein